MAQGGRGSANKFKEGTNHPAGVVFQYFVNDLNDNDELKLRILEPDGDLIKEYSSKGKNAKLKTSNGGHRLVWNMRYDGFKEFPGMVLYSSPNRGPKAVPGQYKAELIVNDSVEEQIFEIKADPRMETTQEEYQQQFDYLIAVRDKVSEAHQAILDIRELKKDIKYVKDKIDTDSEKARTLKKSLASFTEELEGIENNIHMTKNQSYQDPLNYGIRINNRLSFLLADQQRGDYAPTDQAEEFRKEVSAELDVELNSLDEVIQKNLPVINEMTAELGIKLMSKRGKIIKP